jgi:hypothetical protein
MTGRPVDVPARDERRRRRNWLAGGVGAVALVALGVAIGSRIVSTPRAVATTVTVTATTPAGQPPLRPAADSRTRAGAVAAASSYVSELDGRALLNSTRLRTIIGRIASSDARAQLVAAYEQATSQARERLGVNTVPAPVVIVRAAPVGYRIDGFSNGAATISIWRVGIVGSGATVEPQQSWRTETVALTWEGGRWKVASFSSSPGPTPPLSTAASPTSPGDLFAAVPQFEAFTRADP